MTDRNGQPVTFEELARLKQTSRTPCGKQGFSLRQAQDAARIRNTLNPSPAPLWVHVCYEGCGRDIFHLTRHRPDPGSKKHARLNAPALKRRRKKDRYRKNQRIFQAVTLATWEGEGGALHPRDLED